MLSALAFRRGHRPAAVLILGIFLAVFGPCVVGSPPAARAQAPDRYEAPNLAYSQKDYATAYRLWLDLADTEGNVTACFNLGRMNLFGEGLPLDLIEAYKWFYLSDRGGLPQAKTGLARVSLLMTPSDIEEAKRRIERWYDRHPDFKR